MKHAVLQLPSNFAVELWSSTRTDDGSAVSVLFNDFKADSNPSDNSQTAEVATVNFEIPVAAYDSKFVLIEARGFCVSTGPHSWARFIIWVNGQRIAQPQSDTIDDGSFYAAMRVNVTQKSVLRVSVTLLAQRDLFEANSTAQCGLDSLDFSAVA